MATHVATVPVTAPLELSKWFLQKRATDVHPEFLSSMSNGVSVAVLANIFALPAPSAPFMWKDTRDTKKCDTIITNYEWQIHNEE